MSAAGILRGVAVLAALQAVGHGLLFVRAKPTRGPEAVAVVQAMQSNKFKFAAAARSYWDMYFGYGLEAVGVCVVEAILFWLLAGATASNPALVRSVAILFAAGNVAHIAMLVRFFAFPVPMVFDALIAAGLIAVAAIV